MNIQTTNENPLGTQPVKKLLMQFSIPSIVAMLGSSLYNIVDQFFIGRNVGELGNAATNISFPLSISCIAIALLFGIGGASAFNLALGKGEKKKALEMVLTPSGNQLEQCSDIQMYFQRKIDETMEIFYTNFKTNLVVNAEIRKLDGIVQTFITLTYRVYKIEDKYFPLITTFEKEDCNVEKSYIISPEGVKEISEKDVTSTDEDISPINVKTYSYEIPEELYKYPYLTIKKTVIEKGYNHWTNFHWNTLTPTDGITFTLKCYDELHIKEYFIFDSEEFYNVTEADDKTSIDIISTLWLDKHSGFVFTVSDTE